MSIELSVPDYTMPERMERLPFSSYQKKIWAVISTAWWFDSMDVAMLTFLLGSIRTEFNLSTAQAGLLSSMSFLGMFLGASLAGILGDKFGRKVVFQWSIVFWGLASAIIFFVPSYEVFLILRLVLGFGMGMEFPVAQSLLSEFMPAKKRGRYVALMEGGWPLGFCTAGILAYFLLPVIGWRGMFLVQAIPAVFVLIVRRTMPESPRWLEDIGRLEDADRTMTLIEENVKKSLGRAELPEPKAGERTARGERKFSFAELWAPGYAKRTIMAWMLWFFVLLGYYGLTSWISALLQAAGYTAVQSVGYTVIMSVIGAPGFFVSAMLLEIIGRKPNIILMLTGAAIAAYLYGTAQSFALVIAFGALLQFFQFGFWSVIYAYTPELYPTRARATGAGFASGVGRLGSIVGPYVVGLIIPTFGKSGVFTLGAISFFIAALVVAILGIETKGRVLEEISH